MGSFLNHGPFQSLPPFINHPRTKKHFGANPAEPLTPNLHYGVRSKSRSKSKSKVQEFVAKARGKAEEQQEPKHAQEREQEMQQEQEQEQEPEQHQEQAPSKVIVEIMKTLSELLFGARGGSPSPRLLCRGPV